MLSIEEEQAFEIARKLVLQAAQEEWNYVSLSPFFQGDGEIRPQFSILSHLSSLPVEIRQLKEGISVELRGTQIRDLKPLAHVRGLRLINFDGIPAAGSNPELQAIAAISEDENRTNKLVAWLKENKVDDPPEVIAGGPEFKVGDLGPITLVDRPLSYSDDDDQEEMQFECRRKALELLKIVDLAANVAPDLPATLQRYRDLIDMDPAFIGARKIWSVANSLEAALEVHNHALETDRVSEELPAAIALKLRDLAETHRVWFLGHPGAREVESRARKHAKHLDTEGRRKAASLIVEAAEASSAVAKDATVSARENIRTSSFDTPAGLAALGELEEWSWNFVASVVRKAWKIAKDPPGGFASQTIASHYLITFLISNDEVIRQYAYTFMSQGPTWWDALSSALRRLTLTSDEDHIDS